jgi:hypothetical protein
MLDKNTLRNEFVSIDMNPATGGIGAVRQTGQRKSLASQRMAFRYGEVAADQSARYGELRVDKFRCFEQGKFRAVCLASGEILRDGESIARFTQTTSLVRGSRVVDYSIKLTPVIELTGPVLQNCFCTRLAWPDTTAKRWRFLRESRQRCCREQFTSPLCLEIESEGIRLSLFSNGLSWHRQSALNILDSVLPDDQNGSGVGNFAIGLDVERPLERALRQIEVPFVADWPAAAPDGNFRLAGWETTTLHWYGGELVCDENNRATCLVFQFRETEGEKGTATIQLPNSVASAEVRNSAGKRLADAEVVAGRVKFSYRASQIFSLAVFLKT